MVYNVMWFVFLLLLIPSVSVSAQKKETKISISGYVTDSFNNPVRGVRVITDRKGTKSTANRRGVNGVMVKILKKTYQENRSSK